MQTQNQTPLIPVTIVDSAQNHSGKGRRLSQIILAVKDGHPKFTETQKQIRVSKDNDAKKLLKQTLPAFSLGKYMDDYISSKNCIQSFGMVIDIDNLDPEKLKETFTQVSSIPEVYAAFRSPSGNGIKALLIFEIPLDSALSGAISLPNFYRHVYRYYTQKLFRMENLDEKTCDICRLCFLAHDPDLYVNPNPKFLEVEKDKSAILAFNEIPPKSVSVRSPIPCGNGQDYAEEPLTAGLKARITEASKYLSDLSEPDWFRIALILRAYGEFGWQTFLALSQGGAKYKDTESEIRKKFDSAGSQSPTDGKVTLGTLFHLAKVNGWISNPAFWVADAPEDECPEITFPPSMVIPFLTSHGFHRFQPKDSEQSSFIQVVENIVYDKTHEEIVDFLRHYIETNAKPFERKLVLDAFLNTHEKFAKKSLFKNLDILEPKIVKDTKDTAYFFFKNCWIQITKDNCETKSYAELPGHIFESQINSKTIQLTKDFGDMEIFMRYTTSAGSEEIRDKRYDSLRSVIGCLLHSYNNCEKAFVLTDERFSEDISEANGGTGKTIFGDSIGHLRPSVSINGKKWDGQKQFAFQEISEQTKVIHFNDVKIGFNLEDIFNEVSTKVSVEKKNRDPFALQGLDRPKIIVSTNFNLKGNGGSFKRRIYTVELNQHYNDNYTPINDFGKRFFDDWDQKDWNRFFSFYFSCLQFYLKNGLTEEVKINSDKKKVQVQVGAMFFEYFNTDRIADVISRSNKADGINIETLYQEYISANQRGTEKLTCQTFSRNLNSVMNLYKVDVDKQRQTVNDKKETRYTYRTSYSTDKDVQIAVNEMSQPTKSKREAASSKGDENYLEGAA